MFDGFTHDIYSSMSVGVSVGCGRARGTRRARGAGRIEKRVGGGLALRFLTRIRQWRQDTVDIVRLVCGKAVAALSTPMPAPDIRPFSHQAGSVYIGVAAATTGALELLHFGHSGASLVVTMYHITVYHTRLNRGKQAILEGRMKSRFTV